MAFLAATPTCQASALYLLLILLVTVTEPCFCLPSFNHPGFNSNVTFSKSIFLAIEIDILATTLTSAK